MEKIKAIFLGVLKSIPIPLIIFLNNIFDFINALRVSTINVILIFTTLLFFNATIIVYNKYKETKTLYRSLLTNCSASIAQYVVYITKRSALNKFKNEMEIIYTINDSEDQNYLDAKIEYKFDAVNNSGEQLPEIFIHTKLPYYFFHNPITYSANYERQGESEKNIPARGKRAKRYKIIEWSLPFTERPTLIDEPFKYNFTLNWEKFFNSENLARIIISPQNYSIKTTRLNIKIINKSKLHFSSIEVKEYMLEPFNNQPRSLANMRQPNRNRQEWSKELISLENRLFTLALIK